ncbi:MAG: hypothetical protein JWO06_550 [Bacteroidota bacterium]|nr:hypothetical protein [Bacteroidota bacterium]
MNITPKDSLKEFNRFLFREIDLNLYQHKYLNAYLGKVRTGQSPIYNSSIINTLDSSWILILHGEMLLVYGNNWSPEQVIDIKQNFELNKYTNYILAGDEKLIKTLISIYKVDNFKIEKRRIFFQSKEIKDYNNDDLKIRLGKLNDLHEVALMLQHYYHEEYNGLNDKTIEEMRERSLSLLQNGKVNLLLDQNELILSFCTTIDPDIGILFTRKEYRNKGYGKVILSYCAKLLLRKNGIVYLMTDKDKIESNIVCKTVGFVPYYEYISTKINSTIPSL